MAGFAKKTESAGLAGAVGFAKAETACSAMTGTAASLEAATCSATAMTARSMETARTASSAKAAKSSLFAAFAVAFCACLFLSACGGEVAEYYPLSGSAQVGSPKNPDDVAVFITKKPDYPYEELGLVVYDIPSGYSDEPAVYRILREKAAQVGADAIIIMDNQTTFERRAGAPYWDGFAMSMPNDIVITRVKYRAMAIKRK